MDMDLYLFDWFEFGLDIIVVFAWCGSFASVDPPFVADSDHAVLARHPSKTAVGKLYRQASKGSKMDMLLHRCLASWIFSGNAEHHDMFWATQNHDVFLDQQIFPLVPTGLTGYQELFFRGRSFRSSTSLNLSEPDVGDMAATRGKLWLWPRNFSLDWVA